MPSLARRVLRRYLPRRVRALARALVGDNAKPVRLAKPVRPPTKRTKPSKQPAGKPARGASPPFTAGPLVEVLRRGGTLADAVVAETRDLLAQGQRGPANAIASALRSDSDTADLGLLVTGIVAAAGDYHALAWTNLRELPEPSWSRYAAREFARSGLRHDPVEALRRIADLADRAPDFVPAAAWLALIGPVFGHGDQDLAKRLFALLDAAVGTGASTDRSLVINRDWLRPWISAVPDSADAPRVPDGSVSFAIMAYGHPGRSRASANIGDHIQSLASLGHLARHQRIDYDGPQDIVDLMRQLRGRVRPELQRDSVEATVQVVQIDRDASKYSAIPPDTWALAFGWYMHAIFETRYDFPFHQNLLPIFVSFHCSKRELLTDPAVAYLRRFGPIGCRDWTTVDILLSVGVPAFFSGCLTTTVRTVFADPLVSPGPHTPVAYVDMPPATVPKNAPVYAHSNDAIRFRSFAANVGAAIDLLETYRERHSGLVTSRLHCYLPARSLGVPVDFQPNNRSDPRFAGLIDITDAEFDIMQSGIDDRLQQIIEAISAGRTPEEVYDLWRHLNADDVATAERRRAADHRLPSPRSAILAALPRVRETVAPADPEATPVVIVAPAGHQQQAIAVLIGTVADHAAASVEFSVFARDARSLELTALEAAAGHHRVRVIDTAGLGEDLRAAGRRASRADLDRLVLPELLHDLDRVVVLPAAAVVYADVAELAATDLGGHLLAAADPAGRPRTSGFGVLNIAANRLRNATAASAELRRRAYARHRFDFDAFATDVLVLDLAAWRARDIAGNYLAYVEEFGLSYRELLHFVVGPDRAVLAERWHAVPGRSSIADPALVHWGEPTKPWSSDIAPDRERWYAARDRLDRRR